MGRSDKELGEELDRRDALLGELRRREIRQERALQRALKAGRIIWTINGVLLFVFFALAMLMITYIGAAHG